MYYNLTLQFTAYFLVTTWAAVLFKRGSRMVSCSHSPRQSGPEECQERLASTAPKASVTVASTWGGTMGSW
jgi:hypothetical protein